MVRSELQRELQEGKGRGDSWLVMAGLVPAIPIVGHCILLIEIAGTSPAMTSWMHDYGISVTQSWGQVGCK
jgi:hypothetical protein